MNGAALAIEGFALMRIKLGQLKTFIASEIVKQKQLAKNAVLICNRLRWFH